MAMTLRSLMLMPSKMASFTALVQVDIHGADGESGDGWNAYYVITYDRASFYPDGFVMHDEDALSV